MLAAATLSGVCLIYQSFFIARITHIFILFHLTDWISFGPSTSFTHKDSASVLPATVSASASSNIIAPPSPGNTLASLALTNMASASVCDGFGSGGDLCLWRLLLGFVAAAATACVSGSCGEGSCL